MGDALSRWLDAALRLEGENLNTYEIYSEITEHFSLKPLLNGLIEGVKNHLKELEEWLEASNPPEEFEPDLMSSLPEDPPDVPYSFDANMSYTDFLQMILTREIALVQIYEQLSSVAEDDDAAYFFRRLAEDGRKQMSLARSRYDLETMR